MYTEVANHGRDLSHLELFKIWWAKPSTGLPLPPRKKRTFRLRLGKEPCKIEHSCRCTKRMFVVYWKLQVFEVWCKYSSHCLLRCTQDFPAGLSELGALFFRVHLRSDLPCAASLGWTLESLRSLWYEKMKLDLKVRLRPLNNLILQRPVFV